jgi:hypothetical protein
MNIGLGDGLLHSLHPWVSTYSKVNLFSLTSTAFPQRLHTKAVRPRDTGECSLKRTAMNYVTNFMVSLPDWLPGMLVVVVNASRGNVLELIFVEFFRDFLVVAMRVITQHRLPWIK